MAVHLSGTERLLLRLTCRSLDRRSRADLCGRAVTTDSASRHLFAAAGGTELPQREGHELEARVSSDWPVVLGR